MELNDFQELCTTTAVYPKDVGIEYCALGLVSEVGEVAGKMKKFLRGDFTLDVLIDGMYKELGDVLWYVAMLAEELDVPLDDLAERKQELLKVTEITDDSLPVRRNCWTCVPD